MLDEFPGQAFLTAPQVQKLLAYKDRKQFVAFLAANPTFPKLVKIGKTPAGKPRMVFPKHRVYSWIEDEVSP